MQVPVVLACDLCAARGVAHSFPVGKKALELDGKIRWELSIAGHITCLQLLRLHGSGVRIIEHSTLRGEPQLKLRQMLYSRSESGQTGP